MLSGEPPNFQSFKTVKENRYPITDPKHTSDEASSKLLDIEEKTALPY